MSDWIKKLREHVDEDVKTKQHESEMRLHRATLIRAKAPAFWQSLTERVKADCQKLSEAFRDDLSRQCSFEMNRHDVFQVQGHPNARSVTLRLHLNLEGLRIDQELFTGLDSPQRTALNFDLDKNEKLFITGIAGMIGAPEDCSEPLIKQVIGGER